jgi:hypothetical protein
VNLLRKLNSSFQVCCSSGGIYDNSLEPFRVKVLTSLTSNQEPIL